MINIKLIIAEKGALAKSIVNAIPGTGKSEDGVVYKGDYAITAASGHLLSLKDPEDYSEKYEKWSLEQLPIYFDNWEKKVKSPSVVVGKTLHPTPSERLVKIRNLLTKSDCVIHAGDPDEEGQLLIDEILEWFQYTGPVYRLQTADTTAEALAKALNHLEPNSRFYNEGRSANARSVADYMVGINLSRWYTIQNGTLLTIGRVQSPTLGLVVERDLAIENHIKSFYYDITGIANINGIQVPVRYVPPKEAPYLADGKIVDKKAADYIAERIKGEHEFVISSVKESESPPLPFNLGKLQSYCAKKWGYSLKKTLDITQSLRDKYNAITYNRTDVQYLPETVYHEAPKTTATVVRNISYTPPGLDPTIHSRCFNDANIEAHFAIIPQNVSLNISSFTAEERNVYLAIAKYYLAQFLPKAEKEKRILECVFPGGGKLTATSTTILSPGFLTIFRNDESFNQDSKTPLSEIDPGKYSGNVESSTVEQKETRPPARYTQATLNEDMTRISKYVDDEEVKKLLIEKDKDKKGENGSIGTVATRAGIIEGLISRGFLEEKKSGKENSLISTVKGRELYRILPISLKKPNLTAYWWVIQEKIKSGESTEKELENNVLEFIEEIIKGENCEKISQDAIISSKIVGKCPVCGGNIVEGKKGFGCSNWKSGCKFVIWKKQSKGIFEKTEFTPNDAKRLLEGKTIKKKKLLKKDGTFFEAGIKLNNTPNNYGSYLELVFKK